MISPSEWQNIRQIVADAQRAAMHCSIATVNPQGFPSITPIGTVFLDHQSSTGFFFDTYSTTFSENLQHQPLACIQAVNSSKLFWLSSMFKGKFKHYPGYMQRLALYVLQQRKRLRKLNLVSLH